MTSTSKRPTLAQLLQEIAEGQTRDRVSVADLLTMLGDRAHGALLFIFAVPNILPVPPGTSTLLGLPLVLLAAQLAMGRRPWLPAFILQRSLSREDFLLLVRRVGPWLARAERLLRPRARGLSVPPMEYVVGVVCLLLSIILVLPIPLGNALPALAISVMALGVLEKDGVWVLVGLLIAVASSIIVSGVIFVIVKAAIFFVQQVL